MAKLKENEKFKKLNSEVGLYTGLYARWRSSGCKGEPPEELIDQMVIVNEKIDQFLTQYKRDDE